MLALIFLYGPDKIRTYAQVDRLICVQFPDLYEDLYFFNAIKQCMVHGLYGTRNIKALWMKNGKCTKSHPKDFVEATTMDQNGYRIYCRRNRDQLYMMGRHKVDNRDVVLYNPYLSRMFNCYINVKVCAGIRCVKYIYKYIYKSHDRTTMVLGGVDEIQQYLDASYIGPVEAAW